jgi:type IV pilus assembly protein PilO
MMNELNLNELTLENISIWPQPVKIVLITIISILLVGFGYWFIVKPDIQIYDSLTKQELTLRKEFEKKQQQASNLNLYKAQIVEMKRRFGKLLKQLPSKNEMHNLLEEISRTGIASGLRFELFAPMQEIQHDFYVELPIKMIVVGNYHQLAVFLSRVASMSRIVTLHNLVIENLKQDTIKKAAPGSLLSMKLTAKIYRYRSF